MNKYAFATAAALVSALAAGSAQAGGKIDPGGYGDYKGGKVNGIPESGFVEAETVELPDGTAVVHRSGYEHRAWTQRHPRRADSRSRPWRCRAAPRSSIAAVESQGVRLNGISGQRLPVESGGAAGGTMVRRSGEAAQGAAAGRSAAAATPRWIREERHDRQVPGHGRWQSRRRRVVRGGRGAAARAVRVVGTELQIVLDDGRTLARER